MESFDALHDSTKLNLKVLVLYVNSNEKVRHGLGLLNFNFETRPASVWYGVVWYGKATKCFSITI